MTDLSKVSEKRYPWIYPKLPVSVIALSQYWKCAKLHEWIRMRNYEFQVVKFLSTVLPRNVALHFKKILHVSLQAFSGLWNQKTLLTFFVSGLPYNLLSTKLSLDRNSCPYICRVVASVTDQILQNFLFATHKFSHFWGSFAANGYLCL